MRQLALKATRLEPGFALSHLAITVKLTLVKSSAPIDPLSHVPQTCSDFRYLSIISSGFLYLSIV